MLLNMGVSPVLLISETDLILWWRNVCGVERSFFEGSCSSSFARENGLNDRSSMAAVKALSTAKLDGHSQIAIWPVYKRSSIGVVGGVKSGTGSLSLAGVLETSSSNSSASWLSTTSSCVETVNWGDSRFRWSKCSDIADWPRERNGRKGGITWLSCLFIDVLLQLRLIWEPSSSGVTCIACWADSTLFKGCMWLWRISWSGSIRQSITS